MNKKDIGKKFYRDGKIYEVISYTDMPTLELRNIDNIVERISVVVDSDYSKEFQLIEDKLCKILELIRDSEKYDYEILDEIEEYIIKEIKYEKENE